MSEDNEDARDVMLHNLIMTRVNTALDIKRVEMTSSVYNESIEDNSIIDIVHHKSSTHGKKLMYTLENLRDCISRAEYAEVSSKFNASTPDWVGTKKLLNKLVSVYIKDDTVCALIKSLAMHAGIKGV